MEKNSFETALLKEICPVCTKEIDGPIVMNTRLTAKDAEEVKKLHGQVHGYAPKPCDTCTAALKETPAVYCIEVDEKLSEDMNNPYRTGFVFAMKQTAIERIFGITGKTHIFINKEIVEELNIKQRVIDENVPDSLSDEEK